MQAKTLEQHQCLSNCQCTQKTTVSVVEKQQAPTHLGYLIAEDLRANGIENPLISNKKKVVAMTEAEKIAKIEG
jgi:uncharacterized protein YejL (UPF0352 family)